jgi:fumarate reductase subunit D
MPGLLLSLLGKFAGAFAGSTLLAWVVPLLTGVGGAVGTIAQAVAEIVLALAKSPEGRVVLFLAALGCAGLYGRYHYIEQGRAEVRVAARAETSRQIASALAKQRQSFKCPAPARRRTRY